MGLPVLRNQDWVQQLPHAHHKVQQGGNWEQRRRQCSSAHSHVLRSSHFREDLQVDGGHDEAPRVVCGGTLPLLGGLQDEMARQRLRHPLSGGAPLSGDTHSLTRTCLSTPIMQGYGLTETASCATVTHTRDRVVGRAGSPLYNVDIKLVDWE